MRAGVKPAPTIHCLTCSVGARFILARTERTIVPIFVLETLNLGIKKFNGAKNNLMLYRFDSAPDLTGQIRRANWTYGSGYQFNILISLYFIKLLHGYQPAGGI